MENSQKKIRRALDYFSAPQLLMVGFASVILTGAVILMLPISVREGATVSFIDALFTSTSAVCVTGLIAIDTANHFTVFGRAVVADLGSGKKDRLSYPKVDKRILEYRFVSRFGKTGETSIKVDFRF